MRRERPRLIWEDCVKRDVKKAREEEDWNKKTRARGGSKILSYEAVKKLSASTSPLTKGKIGRERLYLLLFKLLHPHHIPYIMCAFANNAHASRSLTTAMCVAVSLPPCQRHFH